MNRWRPHRQLGRPPPHPLALQLYRRRQPCHRCIANVVVRPVVIAMMLHVAEKQMKEVIISSYFLHRVLLQRVSLSSALLT